MSDDVRREPRGLEGPTKTGVVPEAIIRIRRDPMLVVPFVIASVVLTGVDLLRRNDPIPTEFAEGVSSGTVSVTFHVYPTAAQRTALPFGALVDLKLPYLAWAIGLELLAVLVVGVAGWHTLVRATNAELSLRGLGSYLGFVVAIQAVFRLFGLFGDFGTFWGIVLIAVFLSAMVRLFVAPAFVAAGNDLSTASRRSARTSKGMGMFVASLVVAFGLATWLLGSVPLVGAFLSGTLVAPVHAVTIAVLAERSADGVETVA